MSIHVFESRDDVQWLDYLKKLKNKILKGFLHSQILEEMMDLYEMSVEFDESKNSFDDEPFEAILKVLFNCASEMVESYLFDKMYGIATVEQMNVIWAAAFVVTFKLFGASDFVYDDNIGNALTEFFLGPRSDISDVMDMESELLKMTDWKGCSALFTNRRYNPFALADKVKEDDWTQRNYGRIFARGKRMLQKAIPEEEENAARTIEILKEFNSKKTALPTLELFMDQAQTKFLVKDVTDPSGKSYDTSTASNEFGDEAHVIVDRDLVDTIQKAKKMTAKEAEEWLENRVLSWAFQIEPIPLTIREKTVQFGRNRRSAKQVKSKTKRSVKQVKSQTKRSMKK